MLSCWHMIFIVKLKDLDIYILIAMTVTMTDSLSDNLRFFRKGAIFMQKTYIVAASTVQRLDDIRQLLYPGASVSEVKDSFIVGQILDSFSLENVSVLSDIPEFDDDPTMTKAFTLRQSCFKQLSCMADKIGLSEPSVLRRLLVYAHEHRTSYFSASTNVEGIENLKKLLAIYEHQLDEANQTLSQIKAAIAKY